MDEKYAKALAEVNVILNQSSEEELNKIPNSFMRFIKEHMDKNYEPQIDFDENFENTVLEETLLILALIYRDYLTTEEEKKLLVKNEAEQLNEIYNVEKLFNKRKIEQQLIVIKEEKWYERILKIIKSIFKK